MGLGIRPRTQKARTVFLSLPLFAQCVDKPALHFVSPSHRESDRTWSKASAKNLRPSSSDHRRRHSEPVSNLEWTVRHCKSRSCEHFKEHSLHRVRNQREAADGEAIRFMRSKALSSRDGEQTKAVSPGGEIGRHDQSPFRIRQDNQISVRTLYIPRSGG